METILLVEDDGELAQMIREFLSAHQYEVVIEGNGLRASERLSEETFDAVILDIGLPGTDGFDVCRRVRPTFHGPIIVLTARGDEMDEVVALEVGADDFMSKPVRPHALLARLKSHLRKVDAIPQSDSPELLNTGDLTISLSARSVELDGKRIDLTTAEYDLLVYLAKSAGKVVDRKAIYIDLQEIPYDGIDRSIDLRISRLRRKLGDDPVHPTRIKSVRGVGYLLSK